MRRGAVPRISLVWRPVASDVHDELRVSAEVAVDVDDEVGRCFGVEADLAIGPDTRGTALGTTCPVLKLRFDAFGIGVPHGHTVTNPPAGPPIAVTFSETAAPLIGTPPRPATSSSSTDPLDRRPMAWNRPSIVGDDGIRESNNRAGTNEPNDAAGLKWPLTSTMRSDAVSV